MKRHRPPTAHPDKYFAKISLSDPVWVAELLTLFRPLLAQLAAAGVRTRYVDLLAEAHEAMRVRCVNIVTAGIPAFRPVMRFPDVGTVTQPNGVSDVVHLTTVTLRAMFLLRLVERYAKSTHAPDDAEEVMAALVVGLRRVIEDPETTEALFP